MILTELTGIKNFSDDKTLIELFQKFIEESKYDLLGSGQKQQKINFRILQDYKI